MAGEQDSAVPTGGDIAAFRALVAAWPLGVFLTDRDGHYTYTTPRYQEIIGVPPEASLGDVWLQSVHPDDRAVAAASWAEAVGEGQEYAAERRIMRPAGTVRRVNIRAAPVRAETGELRGFVGTLEDVTEGNQENVGHEREVPAEAGDADTRYRALFEAAADAILVADADGRYLDANPAACSMLGYTRDELLRLRIGDISARAPEGHAAEHARLARDGGWWGESALRRKDGSLIPVEVRAARAVLPTGPIYFAAFRDITEQQHEGWLATEHAIARVLAEGQDLRIVARRIADRVAAGLGFDAVVLWVVDESARLLRCAGVATPIDQRAPAFAEASTGVAFRSGEGVPGRVWASGQPLRLPVGTVDDDPARLEATRAAGLTGVLGYPIRAGRTVVGVLECFTTGERAYEPDVVRVLRAIGGQIGLFVERNRTEAALQRVTAGLVGSRDGESRRLARDLDEAAAQTLVALGLNLARLRELLPETGDEVLANLAKASELGEQGLREIRARAHVRPGLLDERGPANALERPAAPDLVAGRGVVFQAVSASSPIGIFLMDAEGRCTFANARYQAICGVPLAASLGEGWLGSFHPEDRPASTAAWAAAVRAEGDYAAERRIVRPDGTVRWVRARAAPLRVADGEPLGHVGTLEDVTERVEAHRLLERRLAALTQVAANLTVDRSMAATLDAVAAAVVEATEAGACAIALVDEASGALLAAGASGIPAEAFAAARTAFHDLAAGGAPSLTLQVLHERRPRLVRDLGRQLLGDPARAPVHPLAAALPFDTVLFVPLLYGGRGLGVLTACYAPGAEPSAGEAAFLGAVADQTALAVENARLFAAVQGQAAYEERQRLARDLHDSMSQVLYGIGLAASAIRGWLETDPRQAVEPTDQVLALVGAGIAELRALIFDLRPESLAEEGLVAALGKQAAALRARHGLAVEAELSEEPNVPLEVKEALYRVGQEAMTNAVRHARASRVALRLDAIPSAVVLEVDDDGVGFDPTAAHPGHHGLRSMQERVERLGGTLALESAPGRGTRVRAGIPVG